MIFYSFPRRELDKDVSERIYEIMNQPKKEEFLMQSVEDLKLLNYYFQIHSAWARGHEDMLMLSIMINQQISPEVESTISLLCKNFSEKMQSNDDIFTGFHIKELNLYEDEEVKERIKKSGSLIRVWVQELYWEILENTRKISEEEKITLLLDDRYIFESLEEMSKEVKKITDEIKLIEDSLKANSTIKNSISNINRIIDDLNEGYIEKMTNVEIESEFSDEEVVDIKMNKGKEEFIKVLEAEITGKKDTS